MTQLLRITDPETNLILLAVGIIVYILLSCVLVWLSWQLIMGVEFVSCKKINSSSSSNLGSFSAITVECNDSGFSACSG